MPSFRYTVATTIARLVLALLLGCRDHIRVGGGQPRQATHVACIGDSITQGAGSTAESRTYPSRLRARFHAANRPVVVGNFGVGGRTMLRDGNFPMWDDPAYRNAKEFVTAAGPGAVVDVVIMLGTNDSKHGPLTIDANNWRTVDGVSAADRYRAAYRDMIGELQALTPRPVVYLALPPPVYTDQYNIDDKVIRDEQVPIIRALAAEHGLPIIDVYAALTGAPDEFPDGVHPNDAGYERIADAMEQGLNRLPDAALTVVPGTPTTATATSLPHDPVPLAKVTFIVDGAPTGTVTAAPFTVSLPQLTAGDHTLAARLVDTTGASRTTNDVRVAIAPPK